MPATKNEKATVVAVRPTPSWRAMAAYKGACRLTPVVMTNNANARRAARCRLFKTASTAVGAGLRSQRHLPGISAICSRSHRRRDGGGPAGRSLLFPVSWVFPKWWMKAWTKSGGQIDPIFLGGSCTGSMGGMAHDHGPMSGLDGVAKSRLPEHHCHHEHHDRIR